MTQPGSEHPGRRYESEVYAATAAKNAGKSPWAFPPDAAQVAGDYSNKSADIYTKKLEVEGGGYRDELSPSDVDYRSVPHEQLISMVQGNASPEDVDEQGIIVNDLGNAFSEMSQILRQGVANEEAGWQGAGAESAFGYFTRYADWADHSSDAAYLASNRYSQTSAALANARNSMPEPAGQSVDQSLAAAHQQFLSGNWEGATSTLNDMENQAALQQQAQQQAAEVLAQRDLMLHSGGSTQPVYMAVPANPQTDQTSPQFAANDSTVASGSSGVGPMGGSPGGVRTTAGIAPPTTPLPGIGTTTGATPTGGLVDSSGGWSRSPSTVPGTSAGSAGAGILPMTPGQADQTRGTSPRTGGTGGRSGVSPRAGVGGRAAGGGGASGRLGGAGQEAAGRKAGVAEPGARAAAESANSGRAGAAGKSGAHGAGMGPVGNQQKDEDKDHERPAYLLEDDPDSIFGVDGGTDENGNRISPPVIGG